MSRITGTARCASSCASSGGKMPSKMQGAFAAVLPVRVCTRPLAANLSTRPPSARPCPSRPGASPPQPRSQMPPPPPGLPPRPPKTASSPSPAPSAAGALVAAARRLSSARRASRSSTNLARVAHVYFKCVRYEKSRRVWNRSCGCMRASTVRCRFLDRCGDSLGVESSFKDICILAAVLNSRCRK